MNIDRVIGGYIIGAVPAALVLFGLVNFAIIALRKTPEKKPDVKDTLQKPVRPLPKKLRDRKKR
jgi:hypothetical protein